MTAWGGSSGESWKSLGKVLEKKKKKKVLSLPRARKLAKKVGASWRRVKSISLARENSEWEVRVRFDTERVQLTHNKPIPWGCVSNGLCLGEATTQNLGVKVWS